MYDHVVLAVDQREFHSKLYHWLTENCPTPRWVVHWTDQPKDLDTGGVNVYDASCGREMAFCLWWGRDWEDTPGLHVLAEWEHAEYTGLVADLLTTLRAIPQEKRKRGPTEKTRLRAKIFKEIKDARPDLGYDAVAQRAMEKYPELGDGITGDIVRNAYRAMNWRWENPRKIR